LAGEGNISSLEFINAKLLNSSYKKVLEYWEDKKQSSVI